MSQNSLKFYSVKLGHATQEMSFHLAFERCVRVLIEGMNLHLETYTQDTAKQHFIMAIMEWDVKLLQISENYYF